MHTTIEDAAHMLLCKAFYRVWKAKKKGNPIALFFHYFEAMRISRELVRLKIIDSRQDLIQEALLTNNTSLLNNLK